ncbi:hypothetical protein BM1_04383 [Bipolaris maydis]|nr:hypothetical protein BM1_04383 [Bipolaris maydis]
MAVSTSHTAPSPGGPHETAKRLRSRRAGMWTTSDRGRVQQRSSNSNQGTLAMPRCPTRPSANLPNTYSTAPRAFDAHGTSPLRRYRNLASSGKPHGTVGCLSATPSP